MQAIKDKIQFESRREIEEIMVALEKSEDSEKENVKRLIDLLEVMHLSW